MLLATKLPGMKKNTMALSILLSFSSLSLAQTRQEWVVKKSSWSSQDEKNYQDFISSIGEAAAAKKCISVETCLKSSANPYHNSDPSNADFHSDCADLPYYLRTYFSWKNNLPFTYASEVVALGESSDLRYSPMGNAVKKRSAVWSGQKGLTILNSIIPNVISSADFRMEYDAGQGYEAPDFYSSHISREAIVPGTMIYDPAGHVAVVYKVSDDGRIHYIDAHPDNSITSGIYSPKFARSNPRHGAGFKNWRPFKIVNARYNFSGEIVGGQIVMARNSDIPEYGTEQYYGNQPNMDNWKKGQFVIGGRTMNYYDYVRFKMSKGNLVINPVEDFKEILEDICVAVQDRGVAVQNALDAKISSAPHPARLPRNIYGTEGEWETYSSPSRDARLKTSFVDLMNQTRGYFEKLAAHDPTVRYEGSDLKADLRQAYQSIALACTVSYKRTDHSEVTLNLDQVRKRLFDLSFDPYHCAELRWGASGDELSTCQDDSVKRRWYTQEQWLRNQIDRTYEAKMDYSLGELNGPKPGAGVLNPPDVDILNLLQ